MRESPAGVAYDLVHPTGHLVEELAEPELTAQALGLAPILGRRRPATTRNLKMLKGPAQPKLKHNLRLQSPKILKNLMKEQWDALVPVLMLVNVCYYHTLLN